jgi:Glycosyl hydrolase catalytic core
MRFSTKISTLAAVSCAFTPCIVGADTFRASAKRGLVFVPNADTPQDNSVWTQSGSDLTWYYNYAASPSPSLAGSSLEFVPMLFTTPPSTTDTTFLDGVKSLISGGTNIKYVLSFNEPDGTTSTGGSNISPQAAAQAWIRELAPLQKMGIKVGAPAVTGATGGFTWLSDFFTACNCTADFIPIHWYGNFDGLASHMGQVRGA